VRCIPGEESLIAHWTATAIERALAAGARAGLEYVYAVDAPGADRELTFCPVCRDVVLIERFQGQPRTFLADGLRCPRCRTKAHGLFHAARALATR
jgi:pyruvate formate lyase activating enzyme